MDEPEAALSPQSAVITDLAYLGNGRGIRYVDYEDTESYRITKMFIIIGR